MRGVKLRGASLREERGERRFTAGEANRGDVGAGGGHITLPREPFWLGNMGPAAPSTRLS